VVDLQATTISVREAEVLDALGEHLTNAQIAQRLHISVRTVESHVSSLLRKLGAADRRELALRTGVALVRPAPEPEPSLDTQVVGLPATWTTFVGRTAELEELSHALSSNRLVTLVGPGGVGKTRLAVVAASDNARLFAGGGVFVDLVPAARGTHAARPRQQRARAGRGCRSRALRARLVSRRRGARHEQGTPGHRG
jgi:DNA-binding CsgD family transcriptional regulator